MTPRRPRILVVERSSALTEELSAAFRRADGPEFVHLRQTTHLIDVVLDQGPWEMVVAGPSEESQAGLRRLVELREVAPDLGLLVVVDGTDPADLGAFVRSRPDELINLPATRTDLRNAVLATLEAVEGRRSTTVVVSAPAEAGTTRLDAGEPSAPRATVFAIGGPTGGSGKTFVAVNMAYLLARAPGRRVVLIDLDTQFGEITAALQLRPANTMHDILYDEQDRAHDDAELAEALIESLTDTPYGFSVLPAPKDPVQADAIGPDEVARILVAVREQADFVVLDTPTGLREIGLAALDYTDHIVAVTQIDVPGLYNLRSFLDTLDRLGVEEGKRSTILNKDLPEAGVTSDDAVAVLGPVTGSVKFSAAVGRALNAGRPMCEMDPSHEVSRALVTALAPLLPPEAVQAMPRRQRGFRWPWKRRSA